MKKKIFLVLSQTLFFFVSGGSKRLKSQNISFKKTSAPVLIRATSKYHVKLTTSYLFPLSSLSFISRIPMNTS